LPKYIEIKKKDSYSKETKTDTVLKFAKNILAAHLISFKLQQSKCLEMIVSLKKMERSFLGVAATLVKASAFKII